jgi:uncharacterized protein YrzB (UPF0473 family)
MENIYDKTMTIFDEDGKEVECEILFTYHSDEFNKDYVLFYKKGDYENEEIEINAAIYTENELFDIETDEEWAMIEEVLADFQEDELLADEED